MKGKSVAVAMALLAEPVPIAETNLAEAWRSLWPDDPVMAGLSHRDGAIAFGNGELFGGAMTMPVPVPDRQAGGLAAGSWLWSPDAGAATARHRAHVVVTASTAGPPLTAFQMMTRAAAAVTRATDAIGVYMGGADLAIRGDLFVAMASKVPVPVALWVDLRCRPPASDAAWPRSAWASSG